jgi:succinate dehydrogenase / fumarate reductase flavoprotein subunit
MHGANRLGGNSLSDLLVFGRRAGEGAAQQAAAAPEPQLSEADFADAVAEMTGYMTGSGSEDPFKLHAELQATMQSQVGIFREEDALADAVAKIEEYKRRAASVHAPSATIAYNPGLHLCRDLRNMLTVAEAVARAALMRHESRGAHSRLDYTGFDDYWGEHNIVIHKGEDGMHVEPRPVLKQAHLEDIVEERKLAEKK